MSSVVSESDVETLLCTHLTTLGWTVVQAATAAAQPDGPLARDSQHDVLLTPALRAALVHLNPTVPASAVDDALAALLRDRSAMDLVTANREFYGLLRDGVKVSWRDDAQVERTAALRVIDWDEPLNNTFVVARQFRVSAVAGVFIPDLVGFVNGVPLLLGELKGVGVGVVEGVRKNLATYRHEAPQLFVPNAVVLISNGVDTRVGTLSSTEPEHFARWTRLTEDGPRSTDTATAAQALFEPARFLDLVENFVLFDAAKGSVTKILAHNHQVLGVNAAVARVARYGALVREGATEAALKEARKLGVFWHTQGSGKSYSMAFFVRKVHRKVEGDWSFVVVTDREELDKQIHRTFVATGAAVGKGIRADSAKGLKKLLAANNRVVFTLIQKFRDRELIAKSPGVIVLADEAHRSQYDEFATNLRRALPGAAFMAFTGTPLIAGDETTVERFGDYVSRYPFFQAVEDGATVKLYYEATVPSVQLQRKDLDEALDEAAARGSLSDEEREDVERHFSHFYILLNRSSRLDEVAKNLVDHFLGLDPALKGMVVCVDRPTTLRLYQRVEGLLALRRSELAVRLHDLADDDGSRPVVARRLGELEALETAVVLSRSQGDAELLAKQLRYRADGLVAYAAQRVAVTKAAASGVAEAYTGAEAVQPEDEQSKKDLAWVKGVLPTDVDRLAERFKDEKDPLRLVFVCSMWITGFDAKACGVVYLDKPMANHTLMQTIARANRVFPGKDLGLVVDYVGVLRDLEAAFVAYEKERTGQRIDRPVADKSEVLAELAREVANADESAARAGVSLADLLAGDRLARVKAVESAVECFALAPKERGEFRRVVARVDRLYRAMGEDARRDAYADRRAAMLKLVDALTATVDAPKDFGAILDRLDRVLDEALDADGSRPLVEVESLDLSDLDLAAIARVESSPRPATATAALAATVRKVAKAEAAANPTLLGLQKRVEDAIADYAEGVLKLPELLAALKAEAATLKAHQARAADEGLTRVQLTDFDAALAALGPKAQDAKVREGLKTALRSLADALPDAMGRDWRGTDQGRSRVQVAVRDALLGGLKGLLAEGELEAVREAQFKRVYERGG